MKKMMMIAAMMVATLTANAQFEPGTWSIQPKAGFNISKISNLPSIPLNFVGNDEIKSTFRGGFVIGGEFEYQVAKNFSLAAGLTYSNQGSQWENYELKIAGKTYEAKDIQIELSYIDLPVVANVYLFKGFALKAGVQLGYLASAKFKATTKEENITTNYEVSGRSGLHKWDISIPVGASYEFQKVPIVIDARYNIGVSKLNEENIDGMKDARNHMVQVTVGYKFSL